MKLGRNGEGRLTMWGIMIDYAGGSAGRGGAVLGVEVAHGEGLRRGGGHVLRAGTWRAVQEPVEDLDYGTSGAWRGWDLLLLYAAGWEREEVSWRVAQHVLVWTSSHLRLLDATDVDRMSPMPRLDHV